MSRGPLRFIHAGGLHLERPLSGLTEVPEHLRELFIEAPYQAARRLFDAAIDQRAEFLVLVGELLHDWGAGPRGAVFLADQFARLAERHIDVYWVATAGDGWPAAMELPNGVHRFRGHRVEEAWFERDGVRKARILGRGPAHDSIRGGDFLPDGPRFFTVALVAGEAPAAILDPQGIEYWALGGRSQRETVVSTTHVAHDAGVVQGSRPQEEGPHGCTLVEVDSLGHIELQSLGVDVVRWHHEHLSVDANTSRSDLDQQLRQRVAALREPGSTLTRLVSWTISGSGPLLTQLRRGHLASELLESLRRSYGFENPIVWSTGLRAESTSAIPPQWFEEDSLLGDFLRVTREHQAADSDLWRLDESAGDRWAAGGLLAIPDEETRHLVLRQATTLGMDLLSGEDLES